MMAKRIKTPLALRKPIADAFALALTLIAAVAFLYAWMALVSF